MNDYIKRSSVIAYLDGRLDSAYSMGWLPPYGLLAAANVPVTEFSSIKFFVQNIPAESVSEVIRCKDCKFYHAISKDNVHYCNCVGGLRGIVTDDDFCCYGTREDVTDG